MYTKKWTLLMLVLVLSTCRKPAVYEVQGELLEFYRNGGIGGAQIEVAYAPLDFGSVSGGYTVIETATSDEDGSYELQFEHVAASTFRVRSRKEGYIMQESIVAADQWTTSEVNVVDLRMYASALLRFHVVNNNAPNGKILLKLVEHSADCIQCCTHQQTLVFSGLIDSTFECAAYGNQIIEYEVSKVYSGNVDVATHFLSLGSGIYDVSIKY